MRVEIGCSRNCLPKPEPKKEMGGKGEERERERRGGSDFFVGRNLLITD